MRHILLTLLALFAFGVPAAAEPVLMISIDGLRPGDVIEAEARGRCRGRPAGLGPALRG